MKTSILKIGILSLIFGFSLTEAAWANTANSQAMELAAAKQYDQALSILSTQSFTEKQSYDHRFLKARILSWAGRHPQAREHISKMLVDYPGNADVLLVSGNLEFYQGNLDSAEEQYNAVLRVSPNYTDASNGLVNVGKAREAKRNSGGYNWRIDGGIGASQFDVDNLSDWNEQFLRLERVVDGLAYSGSVTRYERFGFTDVQYGIGLSDALRGGLNWGVDASVTPGSNFRPDFSAGGRLGYTLPSIGGAVYHVGASYRYDSYDSGDIHSIQPELKAYLENGVVLTGRLIGTLQTEEDDQLGWLVDGVIPVNDRLQLKAGYANAPEAINGLAITTKSIFGGLSYKLRNDIDLHLNLARDDREDVYIRESVNVGFTHKR